MFFLCRTNAQVFYCSVSDPDSIRSVDPDPAKKTTQIEISSVADPDPGSGIGYLFDPWIRDLGSGIRDGRKSASGSGIRDPG